MWIRTSTLLVLLFCFVSSFVFTSTVSAQKSIEEIGHATQIGLPLVALGVSALKKDTAGVIQLTKSVLVESVLVYSLKQVIDRKRPNGRSFSFPSGHTALSFTSSTYLYKRYGWQYGVPATVLAAFVGYSRFGIDDPVHFFTDVLAGAAIGVVTSLVFTKRKIDSQKVAISGGWSSDGFLVGVKLKI